MGNKIIIIIIILIILETTRKLYFKSQYSTRASNKRKQDTHKPTKAFTCIQIDKNLVNIFIAFAADAAADGDDDDGVIV